MISGGIEAKQIAQINLIIRSDVWKQPFIIIMNVKIKIAKHKHKNILQN